MSKSRYSKTKGAGLLCGMSRYKQVIKSKQAGGTTGLEQVENRQTRRLRNKG